MSPTPPEMLPTPPEVSPDLLGLLKQLADPEIQQQLQNLIRFLEMQVHESLCLQRAKRIMFAALKVKFATCTYNGW